MRIFVDLTNAFLGANPDGLVYCTCHGAGLVEVKCPWTFRGLTLFPMWGINAFASKFCDF